MPPRYSGWARTAAATRPASDAAGAVAIARKLRASPVSDWAITGAPQPSMPVAATGSPASSVSVSAMAACSGWAGSR